MSYPKMGVILLLLLFLSVKCTFSRNIAIRRLGSDLTTELPELYTNKNILRDLTVTTEAIWEFEEVNYDEVVGLMKTEHNDCLGINIACTMAMGHIRPVCGVDIRNNYKERILSICEMDYRNCLYRVDQKKTGIYGNGNLDNDYLEWTDDGYNCDHLDAK